MIYILRQSFEKTGRLIVVNGDIWSDDVGTIRVEKPGNVQTVAGKYKNQARGNEVVREIFKIPKEPNGDIYYEMPEK